MIYNYHIANAITPLDGRNRNKLLPLAEQFSELSLDSHRLKVEINYLFLLSKHQIIRQLTPKEQTLLLSLEKINKTDYEKIREIEQTTNHDVKALEEYLRFKLQKTSLVDILPMVHFGLTSDDDNNLAYGLMLKNTLENIFYPVLENILTLLKKISKDYKDLPMLGKTHGQPAVATTLGKEIFVFHQRLKEELNFLKNQKIKAKLTGNVGNLNTHKLIYPAKNWLAISQEFIQSFGLEPDLVTTQIEPYDSYLRIFQNLLRINNILLGLSVDCWLYISQGYFKQKLIKTEVGSTALPHKVNPIYFEGAEGGFGLANTLFEFYCRKLSYSRFQRDLSDSTVRRSFGIALSYSYLSYQSIVEALKRIEPNEENIKNDLNDHWEILSEAVQNFLRTKGKVNAYDQTKEFFHGKVINKDIYQTFINSLDLVPNDKKILLNLTPASYTGFAEEIINLFSHPERSEGSIPSS